MIHRFPGFEIDEATREVRVGDRTLTLQPKVFDLLAYLGRHRERVVPKDELLEAVWPGVLVTDGSLQRAVSLARAALAEAGSPDAIRTHGLEPAFVATRMTDWTGIPGEEMIQTEDVVELVRAVLHLSPKARVPNIVVERVGDVV